MMDLKYSEILKLNQAYINASEAPLMRIRVLSNITVAQLNDILEYHLRSNNVPVIVTSGDYDNIVQNSGSQLESDAVIIFWELCNLIEGFQYKVENLSADQLSSIIEKTKNEIDLVLKNLEKTAIVLFNKFSTVVFTNSSLRTGNFEKVCKELNIFLEDRIGSNGVLIDLEQIIGKVSIEKSIDLRYFYSSKALYTILFFKTYAYHIAPAFFSLKGKARKAIIFDCDNTLWKGVLGEDGFDNIEMSSKTKNGKIFEEIQSLAKSFASRGILIGLCSKNNLEDVQMVLKNHSDMILREDVITMVKVNWDDKVNNLKLIAKELNIGLDSIVFVDDSDFEIGLVRSELPEVKCIQVPSNLLEYPQVIRSLESDFFSLTQSAEDVKRTELYKQELNRSRDVNSFTDIDSYLRSLDLVLTIYSDAKKLIPRIAQLTQKTNQFNLTTKRYSEPEISNFTESKDYMVISYGVGDKYGDAGIVGVLILQMDSANASAQIDTLLMSCRVIGRNIEIAFFDYLINELASKGIKNLTSTYAKSLKNEQVKFFFDKLGFKLTNELNETKNYQLLVDEYSMKKITYITIQHGKED
jgi:FkbH-like protein